MSHLLIGIREMFETVAEFRHSFLRFRAFRVHQSQGLFSICMVTGKIDSPMRDVRNWLTGDRKIAFARDISNSLGRETWRYDLSKEECKKELDRWRKRCGDEGLSELIIIT